MLPDASPGEYAECLEWVNCTKKKTCFALDVVQLLFQPITDASTPSCYSLFGLLFVFFFNYLRSPFLPSGFVSAELLTDANKDKLDKKVCVKCCIFKTFFFALGKKVSCKVSWETPVK